MPLLITNPKTQDRLLRRRRAMGGDRWDEVWDGVYVLMPLGDNIHQQLGFELASAIARGLNYPEDVRIFAGTNVTDRSDDWTQNFRCPDVAVYFPTNPAEDRETHWLGGPDFAIEVISPYDRSREKFDFYARVGVRELLLVNRKPWELEFYRRRGETWEPGGRSSVEGDVSLSSAVLGLSFRLVQGERRPRIEVVRATDGMRLLV